VPKAKNPAGCGPFAMGRTASSNPQTIQRRIDTPPAAIPFHHAMNAAKESSVITVSGSAMVSFCNSKGLNKKHRAANKDAGKLA
jgi:hypothetical protein